MNMTICFEQYRAHKGVQHKHGKATSDSGSWEKALQALQKGPEQCKAFNSLASKTLLKVFRDKERWAIYKASSARNRNQLKVDASHGPDMIKWLSEQLSHQQRASTKHLFRILTWNIGALNWTQAWCDQTLRSVISTCEADAVLLQEVPVGIVRSLTLHLEKTYVVAVCGRREICFVTALKKRKRPINLPRHVRHEISVVAGTSDVYAFGFRAEDCVYPDITFFNFHLRSGPGRPVQIAQAKAFKDFRNSLNITNTALAGDFNNESVTSPRSNKFSPHGATCWLPHAKKYDLFFLDPAIGDCKGAQCTVINPPNPAINQMNGKKHYHHPVMLSMAAHIRRAL